MSYAPHHPICDVCGEPKRQTNHWFQIRVSVDRIVIEAFDAKSKSVKHFCGEGCVAKYLAGGVPGKPGVLARLANPNYIEAPADTPIEFPILDQQQPPP